MVRRRLLGWRPDTAREEHAPIGPAVLAPGRPRAVELAGLDREGVDHWSSLKVNDAELIRPSFNDSRGESAYAATTLVRAGLVAGVTPAAVPWATRLAPLRPPVVHPGRLGRADRGPTARLLPSHRTDELIVACKDGTLVCVRSPGDRVVPFRLVDLVRPGVPR